METKTPQQIAIESACEMEENLAGALLKRPSALSAVMEVITPDDIWLERVKELYKAMLKLKEQGVTIDTVTLGDELERHGTLSEFGGRVGLADLRMNFRGDAAESYAVKVLDYSAKRQLVAEAGTLANWGLNGRDSSSIQDDIIKRLSDIKTPNAKADKHTATMKDALSKVYDGVSRAADFKAQNRTRPEIVPTGFIDLDRMYYGGLEAPDFTIIAGRPGQGKSSLLLTIARNAAGKGKGVLFCGLEMSNEQTVLRLVSQESGIPYGAMRDGALQDREWPLLISAVEQTEGLPIIWNDMPAITVNGVRRLYRKYKNKMDIDLIVIDYLQLQASDEKKSENRQNEVASISRGLKAMAKEFDVPVLAAAQLSRATEQRAERRPVLSDLRESGALENDADNVWFIYHPEEVEKDKSKNYSVSELIIAKHRNGAAGTVELIFRRAITKFENAATKVF